MKRLSTILCALALLLLVGVSYASAKETTIYSVDYSIMADQDTAPFYAATPDGSTVSVKDGLLVIDNKKDDGDFWSLQYIVGAGFSTTVGSDYKVKITYKTTVAGGVWVGFGNWTKRATNYGAYFSKADDFQTLTLDFENFDNAANDNFVLMQSRGLVSTIYISKVEVIEISKGLPTGTAEINLDKSKWTGGWNATVDNDGSGNLVLTLTGDYGAKGCSLSSVDLTKYDRIILVFESYTGGWGQLLLKNGGDDVASQTFGGITSTKTIIFNYDNSKTITDLFIQGGTDNPVITISRIFLTKNSDEGKSVSFLSDGFIPAENLSYYSDDALLEITLTAEGSTLSKYLNWGMGKFESAGGGIQIGDFPLKNEGDNVYTYTIGDFRPAFEGDDNDHGDKGVNWVVWGQGVSEGNTFTRKSINVYPVVEPVSVGATGFASYGFARPVNVDGVVSAYAAKYSGSSIVLTPVTEIPAGEGVIIEAPAGEYGVCSIRSAVALGDVNQLLVSDGKIVGNGTSIYALGKDKTTSKVGFILVKNGITIPEGRAYLNITGNAREFIGFGDEDATGVETIKQEAKADNQYFNLSGQRVAQPTKGLYIVNGKKVIIK